MAVGSGIAGSFGIAAETVYGTYVAPSRHFRSGKASVKKKKNVVQGGGLAAGQLAQPGSFRTVTDTSGEGSLEVEVPTTKFGLLLQHIFGSTVTPVKQGATVAYLQTHDLADNIGKFLTVQAGVPGANGTVVPFSGLGTKITSAEFSCDRGGLLTVGLEFDHRAETEAQTLAAPSYTSGQLPFSFKDLTVSLGATFGAETPVDGVTKVSFKIERGQDTERVYAGSGGLKAEPIVNDWVKVTGSIEADFISKTVFVDRFSNDTPTSLALSWASSALADTGYPFELDLLAPMVFFDGDSPELDGPDIVKGSFGWTAQYDLTNPVARARYVSTDTVV